ncbi:MAG: AMP-binding protein, partial [Lachnospiraceae bacterium]|nr:AMP-binding protein [Candidatus Darwinimomas equi]
YEPFEDLAGDDEPALLIYTSGSTGTPKGILHTNSSLFSSAERTKILSEGVSPIIFAAAAPFSFIIHIQEYFCIFLLNGCVHILSNTVTHSLPLLEEYYASHSITAGYLTPKIIPLFAFPSSVQRICTGGDSLLSSPVSGNYRISYLYGQGETCSAVCTHLIETTCKNPSLGKPLPGIEIRILDESGNEVPRGLEGEICVIGEFGAEYFKSPEETQETFIKTDDGKTLIHTGDVGFIDDAGDLNYVSRKDWMVKINGQRVETLEVERVLQSVEHIKEAAVKAFSDADSENYLVGYYVSDAELSIDVIRISLAEKVPPYMIPRYLMRLDILPKNMNGKIDRTALGKPVFDEHHSTDGRKSIFPQNDTQKKIYDIASKIIGHSGFGITSNLYEAGLDSLGSMRFLTEMEQAFHVPLDMNTLYSAKTVENLAAWVDKAKPAEVFELQEDYPITKTQETVYNPCEHNPRYYPSIIYTILKLQDGIDAEKFVSAVETVIDAHPYLKTTLRKQSDGMIRAVRNDHFKADVSVIACENLPHPDKLVRHHELLHSPLYRAELYTTPSGNYFYLDCHHIICDGITIFLILRDICKVYLGQKPGKELCDGFDAGLLEIRKRQSEDFVKAKNYYTHLLEGSDPTEIPCSTEMPVPKMIPVRKTCSSSSEDVESYCHKHGCTKNALFHTAFSYLLSLYDEKKDVLFASTYSGRTDSRLLNTLSILSTCIPVRYSVSEDTSIGMMILDVQDQMYDSISNDVYSIQDIGTEYGCNYGIVIVNEIENLKYVTDLTGSASVISDFMPVFDISSSVMDVVVPKDMEFAGNEYNKYLHIVFFISSDMNGNYVFSVMGNGGRYSESFLDEMLSRYDKIITEFITKEYLSEMVI